ncbi:MAG: bifunctional phosphopantothenoylcysteine decarboxylase/phosphopantothenate--cysteine ligase CoaBC, partial [Bdellovibrionales bacterium]|nr:bifunctional phosphopantothenoylcysteine decarboxylase/phosphopantothenate--cysteine ligase CoaBC [Bdellovibrionales bacterium]
MSVMHGGKKITLCVTASIAVYKAAELVRELERAGYEVSVAMSPRATEFVAPLTFETLSHRKVATDFFSLGDAGAIPHIALADSADLVLVAPATADIMAKAAAGLADEIVSAILLATKAPVIFVPAMNVNMWEHPATQANIRTLGNRGMRVLDPDSGDLICGWQGTGRFPEIAAIVAAVDALQTEQDLKGVRVIVTAGPTQEAIDPVRFVTNRSTGKMGYALADVAARRGAEVLLISGPTQLPSPAGVSVAHVSTAEEMHKTVFAASQKSSANAQRQVIVIAAAVTDHRPT